MRFYIASRLENAKDASASALAARLTESDWRLTYAWWDHGSVQAEGEARMREVALAEAAAVCTADVVIVLLPGGRGTHVELGIALALGKRVVVHAEQDSDMWGGRSYWCAFYMHPNVQLVRGSRADLIDALLAPTRPGGWPHIGPGAAPFVYVPGVLSAIEIEAPANCPGQVVLNMAGVHSNQAASAVCVRPGGVFAFTTDSKRSAATFAGLLKARVLQIDP